MFGIYTSPSGFRCLQTVITNTDYQSTKNKINVCARISQCFFGSGVLLTTASIVHHMGPLLSGGSFLYYGMLLAIKAFEAVICYDLFRVSTNVTSVFEGTIISNYRKKQIPPPINTLIDYTDHLFSLPPHLSTQINNSRNLTKTLTHDTILVQCANQSIKQFLDKPV